MSWMDGVWGISVGVHLMGLIDFVQQSKTIMSVWATFFLVVSLAFLVHRNTGDKK